MRRFPSSKCLSDDFDLKVKLAFWWKSDVKCTSKIKNLRGSQFRPNERNDSLVPAETQLFQIANVCVWYGKGKTTERNLGHRSIN